MWQTSCKNPCKTPHLAAYSVYYTKYHRTNMAAMLRNSAKILNFQRSSLQKLQILGNSNKCIWIGLPVDFDVLRLLNKRNTSYSLISDRVNSVSGLVTRFSDSDKSIASWSISADNFGPMLTKKH